MKKSIKTISLISSLSVLLSGCSLNFNFFNPVKELFPYNPFDGSSQTDSNTDKKGDSAQETKISITVPSDEETQNALKAINIYDNDEVSEDTLVTSFNTISNYLKELKELREKVSKSNSAYEDAGSIIETLYVKYWTIQSDAYEQYYYIYLQTNSSFTSLQNKLTELLGEEQAKYVKGRYATMSFMGNTYKLGDRMFMSRVNDYSRSSIPEDVVTEYTDIVIADCSLSSKKDEIEDNIQYANYAIHSLAEYYRLIKIRADINSSNEYYNTEQQYLYDVLINSSNNYNKAFKTALSSSYREDLITDFKLSDATVKSFEDVSIYSDDILDLESEINTLSEKYETLTDIADKKEIYIELVNKRNDYIKLINDFDGTSYKNYEEYAFAESFARDFTTEDADKLVNNVCEEFIPLWKQYNGYSYSSDTEVNEEDLWNALTYVDNILDDASDVYNYIKYYGLYSFDNSPSGYNGSYVANIGGIYNNYYNIDENDTKYHDNDNFLYLGATGTINDYSNLYHEFGHYYCYQKYDDDLSTTTSQSYDIAEINSQGLELLMSPYYEDIASKKDAEILNKEEMNDSLWVFASGGAIYEFENATYSYTGELTVDYLDKTWNELKTKYGLENYTIMYYNVPHIYESTGYYISYITSRISALEMWSKPTEEAIEIYKYIALHGTDNNYTELIVDAGLSNPFTENDFYTPLKEKMLEILEA